VKINPILNPNIIRSYQSNKLINEKPAVTIGRDQVSLSEEALSFSKALTEAREMIEARTPEESSRIAQLKEEVRTGQYRVSSEDIAEKILEAVKRR